MMTVMATMTATATATTTDDDSDDADDGDGDDYRRFCFVRLKHKYTLYIDGSDFWGRGCSLAYAYRIWTRPNIELKTVPLFSAREAHF